MNVSWSLKFSYDSHIILVISRMKRQFVEQEKLSPTFHFAENQHLEHMQNSEVLTKQPAKQPLRKEIQKVPEIRTVNSQKKTYKEY